MAEQRAGPTGSATAVWDLHSSAFPEGGTIPQEHTCDGEDRSPDLTWSRPPDGTQSLVLVMHDPDAPSGDYTHWLLWDLPPDSGGLTADVPPVGELPDGARQGRNDFGRLGYGGPCPPPGPAHRYVFDLYALDAPLGLPAGADRAAVESALRTGGELARARLTAQYGRRSA